MSSRYPGTPAHNWRVALDLKKRLPTDGVSASLVHIAESMSEADVRTDGGCRNGEYVCEHQPCRCLVTAVLGAGTPGRESDEDRSRGAGYHPYDAGLPMARICPQRHTSHLTNTRGDERQRTGIVESCSNVGPKDRASRGERKLRDKGGAATALRRGKAKGLGPVETVRLELPR